MPIVICRHVQAQQFSYTAYNTKDGLAGSVVYCAAEDKDGFLWFGTEAGLSRFDGTHFRNFTTADGLPDNEIIKLFVDSRNRVWIAPFKNTISYYLKGQLHTQENDPVLKRLSITSGINSITEDKYGNVILAEPMSIDIIGPDQRTRKITELKGTPTSLPIGGGLNRERLFTFFSSPVPFNIPQYVIGRDSISCTGVRSFVGKGINLTLLTPGLNVFEDGKVFHFMMASGREMLVPVPHDFVSLSKVDDSLVTLNTTNGAHLYNLRTGRQSAFFLKGQSVNAVMRDSEGSLWFMCAGGGIYRIGSLGFRNVAFSDGNNLSVTLIQNIGGALFIGTERSLLWKSDPDLRIIDKRTIRWHKNILGRVMAIVPIDQGGFLLGTDNGLIRMDRSGEVQRLEYFAIKSVTAYKDAVLVSSAQNVELRHFSDLSKTTSIRVGRATCAVLVDRQYFIGTINGLYSMKQDAEPYFWGSADPVFRARITAIALSADSTLWIATSGSGIAGIRHGRLVCRIMQKDGLTSDICRNICISGDDCWIGTDKGLNRVHREGGSYRITTFGLADGLSSDIVNTVYVHNDRVYVGSANGLTYFDIHEAAQSSFCKLRVISIRAASQSWAYDTSGFVLPHKESSIRVDFAGISYRSVGGIVYRYRLKGLSEGWQLTRETSLSYPTLPSGTYALEIVATNKFGVESLPVRIDFTVEKLIWEHAWFIAVAAILLTGAIWVLLWLRVRHLKLKNAEKISINNRLAELEQQSLRAQMNPHFIFNCLNSIQRYVMEKDIRGANKFITDFSRLIRLTLDISSRSRHSIDEEVRYITYYIELEKTRFGNTFEYDVFIDPGINSHSCHIPPMILQPYVENSIRHGLRYREDNDGVIFIRFIENEKYLICMVEDNGIGRKQAEAFKSSSPIEYQSRGMSLTERRLEMMSQVRGAPVLIEVEDLHTETAEAAGTRVLLYFPIQYVKP